jgi:hypothetical protein
VSTTPPDGDGRGAASALTCGVGGVGATWGQRRPRLLLPWPPRFLLLLVQLGDDVAVLGTVGGSAAPQSLSSACGRRHRRRGRWLDVIVFPFPRLSFPLLALLWRLRMARWGFLLGKIGGGGSRDGEGCGTLGDL